MLLLFSDLAKDEADCSSSRDELSEDMFEIEKGDGGEMSELDQSWMRSGMEDPPLWEYHLFVFTFCLDFVPEI